MGKGRKEKWGLQVPYLLYPVRLLRYKPQHSRDHLVCSPKMDTVMMVTPGLGDRSLSLLHGWKAGATTYVKC